MNKPIISDYVKEIIKTKGLKQYYVAELAGIPPKMFSDMLNGRKLVTDNDIVNICKALDITPNELFGFTKDAS